jgi:hypothetical protein
MRAALIALPSLVVLLAAGCGGPSGATPVACLEGPRVFLAALDDAPGQARLGGATPISECLVRNQAAGNLAAVGAAMLTAATKLNAEARAKPGGVANLRLGYLLGAAERGAADTEGIHAELIRRLSAAARYSPGNRPLPPTLYRAYRSGYAAGQRNG